MKTAQEVLEFMSEYADFLLAEIEKENNSAKFKENYFKHCGMRELIEAVIDEMRKWVAIILSIFSTFSQNKRRIYIVEGVLLLL